MFSKKASHFIVGLPWLLVGILLTTMWVITDPASASSLVKRLLQTSSPPEVINYQGFVEDNGVPFDGAGTFEFRLYDAPIGGSALWTSGLVNLTVTDGLFQVFLGDTSQTAPLDGDIFTQIDQVYLQVNFNAEALSPRQQLVSVPYALRAHQADSTKRNLSYATGLGPVDGTDNGSISSRTLTFTKNKSNTLLRISYTDTFRVLNSGPAAASCRWEIRINGQACTNPGSLVYDYFQSSSASIDMHRSSTVVGICENLSAGVHSIGINVGPIPGLSTSDCFTGFSNSRWYLEAEEIEQY